MRFLRFPSCSNINICFTPIQIHIRVSSRGASPPEPPFQHDQTSNARTHAKRAHARAIYFRFATIKVNIWCNLNEIELF